MEKQSTMDKEKALFLIGKKLAAFRDLLEQASLENMRSPDYKRLLWSAEALVEQLFGAHEREGFTSAVTPGYSINTFRKSKLDIKRQQFDVYKRDIKLSIARLETYKEKIENFWEDEPQKDAVSAKPLPFVSKSFAKEDKGVNDYFEGILKALNIKFDTGERYSSDSIPQKVRDRIHDCDLMILILTRRDKLEKGGYSAPAWLIKEVGHAQQEGKPVIALVERGIRDDAGLKMEKELIYLERDSLESMEKATVKFLEALKEHKLV